MLTFTTTPSIAATGVTAGPLKRKVHLSSSSTKYMTMNDADMETNEHAHAKMMEDACMIALSKVDKIPSDADFLLIGDLVNQMTPSNFSATTLGIPYIGMFSACATSVSSLLIAALLTEAGCPNVRSQVQRANTMQLNDNSAIRLNTVRKNRKLLNGQ